MKFIKSSMESLRVNRRTATYGKNKKMQRMFTKKNQLKQKKQKVVTEQMEIYIIFFKNLSVSFLIQSINHLQYIIYYHTGSYPFLKIFRYAVSSSFDSFDNVLNASYFSRVIVIQSLIRILFSLDFLVIIFSYCWRCKR